MGPFFAETLGKILLLNYRMREYRNLFISQMYKDTIV